MGIIEEANRYRILGLLTIAFSFFFIGMGIWGMADGPSGDTPEENFRTGVMMISTCGLPIILIGLILFLFGQVKISKEAPIREVAMILRGYGYGPSPQSEFQSSNRDTVVLVVIVLVAVGIVIGDVVLGHNTVALLQ